MNESNVNIINRLFYKKYNQQEYELIKDIYKYSKDVLLEFILFLKDLKYYKLYNMKNLITYLIENNDYFSFKTKYLNILQNSINKIEQTEKEEEEEEVKQYELELQKIQQEILSQQKKKRN